MKKAALTVSVVFLLFSPVFIVNHAWPQAKDSPREISGWDRFWARWDGIDPEVYVMMKEMDKLMTEMLQTASIAKKEKKEGEFEKWVKEKLTDEIIEITTEYNPAVKPVKKMADYAMKGTKSWLDWGFRYQVNQVYKQYKQALEKTGDIRKATKEVEKWLNWQLEIVTNQWIYKQLKSIAENKEILFANIVKTHQQFHPEMYKAIPPLSRKVSNFQGVWDTNWGEMRLTQSGASVSGSYEWDNGKITGKVKGNVLIGKWSEAPSYSEPYDAGDVELELSEDGNSFNGRWRYGSSGGWGEWTGKRK